MLETCVEGGGTTRPEEISLVGWRDRQPEELVPTSISHVIPKQFMFYCPCNCRARITVCFCTRIRGETAQWSKRQQVSGMLVPSLL